MTEEIIRSEYLYRGHVIKLRLDQTRLANKNVVQREIVEHRGAVAIVALDDQQRVVMVRQFRPAAAREMLEIPAGTLEEGEDPALCAVRELKEETGCYAAQWQALGYFFSAPGFSTEKMFLFLATQLTAGEATPEDDESIRVETIPLTDALAKIESGEIVDAKSIVGLLRVWKLAQ
ncbi:ADP-ribose pyrophosphatase [Anaerolineae bacterium]|nr:ADP-ribose pyrophosphatase [Anaerolineae bacterium]